LALLHALRDLDNRSARGRFRGGAAKISCFMVPWNYR
jgi:hypothetical protein